MSVNFMVKKRQVMRKVNQTGNSLTVSIPKEFAETMNLKKGDDLELLFNEDRGEIIIKKLKLVEDVFGGINPRVLKSMNRVMDEYKDMFENLKDR